MKRILILSLLVFALFGCEKERCFECTATCSVMGQSGSSTQVYCGDLTRAEAKDMAMSMTYSSEGVSCKVECKEQ